MKGIVFPKIKQVKCKRCKFSYYAGGLLSCKNQNIIYKDTNYGEWLHIATHKHNYDGYCLGYKQKWYLFFIN